MNATRHKDLSVIKERLINKIKRYLMDGQPVPEGLRQKLANVENKMMDQKKQNAGKPKPLDWVPKPNTQPTGPIPIDPDNSITGFWSDFSTLIDKEMTDYSILAANAAVQQSGDEAGASSVPKDVDTSYGFDNFQVTILIVGVALALYLNYRS